MTTVTNSYVIPKSITVSSHLYMGNPRSPWNDAAVQSAIVLSQPVLPGIWYARALFSPYNSGESHRLPREVVWCLELAHESALVTNTTKWVACGRIITRTALVAVAASVDPWKKPEEFGDACRTAEARYQQCAFLDKTKNFTAYMPAVNGTQDRYIYAAVGPSKDVECIRITSSWPLDVRLP